VQRAIWLSTGCLLGLLSLGWWARPAVAELRPEEIAVLYLRENNESRAVAAYYAKVREVPAENILPLTMPKGETLSREEWQTNVRPAIRRWLAEGNRAASIRCFLTVWEVPLRIGPVQDDPATTQLLAFLRDERSRRIDQLGNLLKLLPGKSDEPLPGGAPSALPPDASLDQIKTALDQSFGTAQSEAMKITDEASRGKAMQQLQVAYYRAVGLNMVAQSLARQVQSGGENVNPQMRSEFDVVRGRSLGLREGRAALESVPFGLDREPLMLALIQVSDGLYGTVAWIDEQVGMLEKNESHASFDNELSLVAWPDYPLVRWQPNYLHYRFDESSIRTFRPTYMVARLEAPTLKRTRELIDQSMAVEKTGLKGKVYFDARATQQPGYVEYDQSLNLATELIQQHTNLEVVLDTKQELFQPGSAPNAALYCGWYSLAKYVDAFDWAPGAVGYHMASNEARTLRDPESEVWCKRMLEDGVVATIGPVDEPYISAFPRPNEFFALLLSGKYSLVECYWRCLPYTSWTMTLVGDPLYNPFKVSAPLKTDGLDESTRRILLGPDSALEPQPSNAPTN
jgi:uncharacterized protein (TIGR03790 family)